MKVKEIKFELAIKKKKRRFSESLQILWRWERKKLCFLPELFDFYFMIQNLYINNHSF